MGTCSWRRQRGEAMPARVVVQGGQGLRWRVRSRGRDWIAVARDYDAAAGGMRTEPGIRILETTAQLATDLRRARERYCAAVSVLESTSVER